MNNLREEVLKFYENDKRASMKMKIVKSGWMRDNNARVSMPINARSERNSESS